MELVECREIYIFYCKLVSPLLAILSCENNRKMGFIPRVPMCHVSSVDLKESGCHFEWAAYRSLSANLPEKWVNKNSTLKTETLFLKITLLRSEAAAEEMCVGGEKVRRQILCDL